MKKLIAVLFVLFAISGCRGYGEGFEPEKYEYVNVGTDEELLVISKFVGLFHKNSFYFRDCRSGECFLVYYLDEPQGFKGVTAVACNQGVLEQIDLKCVREKPQAKKMGK